MDWITRNSIFIALIALASTVSGHAYADRVSDSTPTDHLKTSDRLATNQHASLDADTLLGETIDLNSGTISFRHVDISIPGNFPIDVSFSRSWRPRGRDTSREFLLGDWQVEIPHVNTRLLYNRSRYSGSWGAGRACSGSLNPGPIVKNGTVWDSEEYWRGDTLFIPGRGSQLLFGSAGVPGRHTADNWKISCTTNTNNSEGFTEGFVAHSPQGIRYTLDQFRKVGARSLVKDRKGISSYEGYMLASKVEDRFGNWVRYHYDDNAGLNRPLLTRISASDGRQISIQYRSTNGRKVIDSVISGNTTWRYTYERNAYGQNVLKRVTRPDGKQWAMSLEGMDIEANPISSGYRPGGCNGYQNGNSGTGSIQHPDGATGVFSLRQVVHGRTNVPKRLMGLPGYWQYGKCFPAIALQSKRITGPGLEPMEWLYHYSENHGEFENGTAEEPAGLDPVPGYRSADLKTTTVTEPDGSKVVHVFNRSWSALDGAEVATEYYNNTDGRLLKRTEHLFEIGAAIVPSATTGMGDFENPAPHTVRRLLAKTLIRSGQRDWYETTYSDFNEYGLPGLISERNSFSSNRRWSRYTYLQDTNLWLLNLPDTTALSSDGVNYTTVKDIDYYSATHQYKLLPRVEKQFGKVVKQMISYHSDGNLRRVLTGSGSDRWKEFLNYRRGIPTQQRFAPRTPAMSTRTLGFGVNDDGTIQYYIDANGIQTNYLYDDLQRLTLESKQAWQWEATSYNYETLPDGRLSKSTRRGQYSKEETYDALLRTVLLREQDQRDSGTERYRRFNYNHRGEVVFSGYPSTSASESDGIWIYRDALSRTIRVRDGNRESRWEYRDKNAVTNTSPEGNQVTIHYLAYGVPEYAKPLEIRSPERVETEHRYNIFGNLTRIWQEGVTETRLFDAQQHLCKIIRPETGQTLFFNNELGEVLWKADGVTGSLFSCENSAANRIHYQYDTDGELVAVNADDASTDDVFYKRDPAGRLVELSTGSLSGSGTASNPYRIVSPKTKWTYRYNDLNLIKDETLQVDGKLFEIKRKYDSLGHASGRSLTSGVPGHPLREYRIVSNALGQEVYHEATYADNTTYWPNGIIKSISSLGSKVNFALSLDDHRRPSGIRYTIDGRIRTDQTYSYDGESNVSKIEDGIEPANTLSNITYDGLGRLTGVYGPWGNGTLRYDTKDNLTSQRFGNYSTINVFDSTTNRLTRSNGQSITYDGRGNMKSKGNVAYIYNARNQLVQAQGNRYLYDGHGRLVRKTRGTTRDYFMYDSTGKLVLSQTGGRTSETIHYLRLGHHLLEKKSSHLDSDKIVHVDIQGSVVAETTKSRWITADIRRYYPYGQQIGSQSNSATALQYTGHLYDKDLGLIYMGERFYDPSIGRFLSPDVVGYHDGTIHSFNRYAYANNNPYQFVDPDGAQAKKIYAVVWLPGPTATGTSQSGHAAFFGPDGQYISRHPAGIPVRSGVKWKTYDEDLSGYGRKPIVFEVDVDPTQIASGNAHIDNLFNSATAWDFSNNSCASTCIDVLEAFGYHYKRKYKVGFNTPKTINRSLRADPLVRIVPDLPKNILKPATPSVVMTLISAEERDRLLGPEG